MVERRAESSKPEESKRINLTLNSGKYNRLNDIGEDQGMTPTDVVKRFMSLGFRVWDEAQAEDFEGVYIKKGGEFIKLPYIL